MVPGLDVNPQRRQWHRLKKGEGGVLMDIGMDTGRPTPKPQPPSQPPPTGAGTGFGGTIALIVTALLVVGLIWGGVSWVWQQVSGGAAQQSAQIETTWNQAAPTTWSTWCTWVNTGNLTGAGSAMKMLAFNAHGYDVDEQAVRDFLVERCT